MKKVVLAGSVSMQKEINKWRKYWEKNYIVLDYPKPIDKDQFLKLYPNVHKEFFKKIIQTDILFVMNENKNNIKGYIGAETFSELTFALVQNLLYNKNIEIILYKMPSKEVNCFEEINLWISLGWIKIYS